MPYELAGRGSDLGLRVWGHDLAASLAAALEGFAASLAEVGPEVPRRRVPVEVFGETPAALLVGLIDEAILRLDTDGQLAVGLSDAEVDRTVLRGRLEVVALADIDIHGVAPKAATWHEVGLEPAGGEWQGQIMLDL